MPDFAARGGAQQEEDVFQCWNVSLTRVLKYQSIEHIFSVETPVHTKNVVKRVSSKHVQMSKTVVSFQHRKKRFPESISPTMRFTKAEQEMSSVLK